MEEPKYRAETCSSPIGETGDYDSWIELVCPDFNLQCFSPDVELEQVQELANLLNEATRQAKNISFNNLVIGSLPFDFIKSFWSLSDEGIKQLEDAYTIWQKRQ